MNATRRRYGHTDGNAILNSCDISYPLRAAMFEALDRAGIERREGRGSKSDVRHVRAIRRRQNHDDTTFPGELLVRVEETSADTFVVVCYSPAGARLADSTWTSYHAAHHRARQIRNGKTGWTRRNAA